MEEPEALENEPRLLARRPPLSSTQRWRTVLAGVTPILLAAVVLTPFAILGSAGVADVVAAALVYGGLLGLAAGFVYIDRVHARMCPRCGTTNPSDRSRCGSCDYDLDGRPRYACEERHAVYLDPGLCACGRRLQRLPVARGIGREIVFILKVGAWLLAFLMGVGLLLTLVD